MADSIQIDVATTTQNVEIQVTEPPADSFFIEYIYPQGPAGVNTWGSLLGTLTAQTDLWNVLSAKALNADLIDLSGNVIDFEAFINSVSGSWNGGQEALTVLAGNSALWDFGYDVATYVQANSAFWEESSEIIPTVTGYLSTVPVTLSSADVRGKLLSAGTDLFDIFLTSETDSQTLSYTPSSYDLSISNGNTVNLSSINSLFGSVSGKYEDVYSSVVNTSGNWDSAYASTTALDLSSGLWNEAYNVSTVYQSTSSSFATNTALNAASSVLTPLTLTNSLTSQLVLNTDFDSYKTDVAAATGTLLPTSIYQGASGFWQNASTNVQSNSANWNTAFNRSTVFSNVSSRYDGSSTVVESASSIWNSASAAAVEYTHTNFLPLSGGSLTGNLTVVGDVSGTGTVFASGGDSDQWNVAYATATEYAAASSTFASTASANTFTENQTFDGANNIAPNQTAASSSSLMTRMLADLRYGAWDNTQEIVNFTGATAGVVLNGSTTFTPGRTQLRCVAGGAYRSFRTDILTQTTQNVGTIAAGGWLAQAVVSLINDSRCFAAYYPVVGGPGSQWAGRAPGVFASNVVTPYFLFRDGSWRAIKATFVRGSASVYPVRASNVITVETNGNHNLVAGDYVAVGGVAPQSMQTVWSEVSSTPTSTSFTYANTGADETGTTILGDNMHIWKVEELGSIAASIASNAFTDPRTWYFSIQLDASGNVTYIANGTTVATGTGFTATEIGNVGRVAFYVESLSTATVVSDFFIYKTRHTVAP